MTVQHRQGMRGVPGIGGLLCQLFGLLVLFQCRHAPWQNIVAHRCISPINGAVSVNPKHKYWTMIDTHSTVLWLLVIYCWVQ